MQLSRNPPNDFCLNWRGLFGAEFVSTSPEILGRRRIGDPDIDPQHPGTAALGAPASQNILASDRRHLGRSAKCPARALTAALKTLDRAEEVGDQDRR